MDISWSLVRVEGRIEEGYGGVGFIIGYRFFFKGA
jgi:hypothetical protein